MQQVAEQARVAESTAEEERALTPQSLFSLDYFPEPPALTSYVTTFYHFRCDEREIRDIQPAAIGHLIVFLSGQGVMRFRDGRCEPSHRMALMTPSNAAALTEVEGPFHCIGAALTPLGWAALTGLHAGQWADRMLRAGEILGEEADVFGEELAQRYHQEAASGEVLCRQLAEFIAPRLRPVNPRHMALIKGVTQWLSMAMDPPIGELYRLSAYSPRQTQRLVERYFGLPPRELMRKYRALRVVALLNQPSVTDDDIATLANCFYDQSHMIREIRHFAGRTPGRLTGGDESILSALLALRNFRDIKPDVAPMPGA